MQSLVAAMHFDERAWQIDEDWHASFVEIVAAGHQIPRGAEQLQPTKDLSMMGWKY